MWGYKSSFTGMDYLRKMAASIARQYNVKIENVYDGVTRADLDKKTVYIRESDAWRHGDDYVVGNLLHEIGHIHLTPNPSDHIKESDHKKRELDLHNLLEDERINEIISHEYEGGAYYLDAFMGDAVDEIAKVARTPTFVIAHTDAEAFDKFMNRELPGWENKLRQEEVEAINNNRSIAAISTSGTSLTLTSIQKLIKLKELKMAGILVGDESSGMREKVDPIEELRNRYKKQVYFTIIGAAIARHGGASDISLHTKEWQEATEKIEALMKTARATSAEEIFTLTTEAVKIMEPWLYTEPSGDGSGGNGKAGVMKGMSTAEMVQESVQRGHKTGPGQNQSNEHQRYTRADLTARSSVDKLRRKLIAKMRENDHQRFHGGKRKGKVDKKALSRVARNNFRLFRKKEERKGVKYTVSVILDTSGSMWSPTSKSFIDARRSRMNLREDSEHVIDVAMQASALLVRTFRSIGFRTSLTMFGAESQQVISHGDIYSLDNIEATIKSMSNSYGRNVYNSGDNLTYPAITQELKHLERAGSGTHKLCIVITDGGLDHSDIEGSHNLLMRKIRAGGFTPIFFYIGNNQEVLGDERYERHIEDIEELIPAAVALTHSAIQGI